MIGRTLSHYRILETIGAGGMGVVYKAEDIRLGRMVAIKMLSDQVPHDRAALERFQREARAASALNHPNICTIYDIDEKDGKPFLVMELLDGETLQSILSRGPLPEPKLIDLGVELCDALSAAHAARIVHRDLKPANIFITRAGHAKILDFGLAKLIAGADDSNAQTAPLDLTKSHTIIGTPPYMSPEQARGEPLDERTDLFSLGAVLYEAATGQPPFGKANAAGVFNAILNSRPKRVSETRAGMNRALDPILSKTLEKDRNVRYQTAGELGSDLKRLERRLSTHALRPPMSPGAMAITAAAVLVVAVAAAFILRSSRHNAAPTASIRTLAVLPFKPIIARERDEALEFGIADTLITKLSSIHGITVRPLSAVRPYGGLDQDPIEAGRRLSVDAVLDGTTENANGKIRVNARLLRISDSSQLWSGHFDTSFADIFSVYDAIASRLADELSIKLTAAEQQQLHKPDTQNPEAYRAYLLGRYYQSRVGRKNLETALGYFRKAVTADPQYAFGYVGLADAYNGLPIAADYPSTAPEEAAKAAATKAIELDPTLAAAYTSLGFVKYWYDWDWAAAEDLFRRSLALNPTYARTHAFYSALLSGEGRNAEALREGEEAERLEPLNIQVNILYGQTLMQAGRLDDAIRVLGRTFEIDPNSWVPHLIMAKAYERKGAYEDALRQYEFAAAHSFGATEPLGRIGHLQAIRGDTAKARQVLEQLIAAAKERYVPPYNIALVYAGLGEKSRALDLLERACDERDVRLVFLNVDPTWDAIRSDPRFRAVLSRVGLKPLQSGATIDDRANNLALSRAGEHWRRRNGRGVQGRGSSPRPAGRAENAAGQHARKPRGGRAVPA